MQVDVNSTSTLFFVDDSLSSFAMRSSEHLIASAVIAEIGIAEHSVVGAATRTGIFLDVHDMSIAYQRWNLKEAADPRANARSLQAFLEQLNPSRIDARRHEVATHPALSRACSKL